MTLAKIFGQLMNDNKHKKGWGTYVTGDGIQEGTTKIPLPPIDITNFNKELSLT